MKTDPLRALFPEWKLLIRNVMRLAFLLFLSTTFAFTPVKGLSQHVTINTDAKDLSVDDVFDLIEEQTSYHFVYQSDMFEGAKDITVKKGEASIDDLLNAAFADTPIQFRIHNGNNIILSKVASLSKADQQKITVEGTVTDEDGNPLPGVNITVEGEEGAGTQTDFDGEYSIDVEKGQALEFSYVGMEPQTLKVEDSDEINVSLKEASSSLDEVVITAFGRKQTRNESTSSVVSVSSEDITSEQHTSAINSLQGKVPGLKLSATTGTPGSSPQVRIRGLNSVTASNDPLYVIDGIPVSSGDISGGEDETSVDIMSLISPGDIENISVLKNASAVAPYGADGANGVVLITTKSGKEGEAKYSLNLSTGIQNPTKKMPNMMNADQKLKSLEEGLWNSYGSGKFGTGEIKSKDDIYDYAYDNFSEVRAWEEAGFPDTDWFDETRNRNAFLANVNFSVRQGFEKSNLYASLGYNKTEGTIIGTNFKRWSGFIKYDTDLNDKLNFKFSALVSNGSQRGLKEGGILASSDNPNKAIVSGSPWAYFFNDDNSYNIDDFHDITSYPNTPFLQETNILHNDVTRALPSFTLDYEILDDLHFKTMFGIDYLLRKFKEYNNPLMGSGEDLNGAVTKNDKRIYHYTTQNSLDYEFNLDDKHNFRITFLQEFNKYKDNSLEGYGENFPNNELTDLSSASSNFDAGDTYTDLMKLRFVGLVSYNFNEKYLLDMSYSYQGDSRFSDKFDSFYSFGLGWNVHKENFLKEIESINELRIKFGYGLTGNAGIDRNQYQQLMSFERYNENPASVLSGFGTEATWEKSRRLDISAEFELFNNRLGGSIGGYFNLTKDMLFNLPIPYSNQFLDGEILQNAGEMENNGLELSLNGDVISTPDFNWNLGANFSISNTIMTSLDEDAGAITARQVIQEGHKPYEWYLPEWAGVDPDNGLPTWYVDRSENDEITNDYGKAKKNYQGTNPLPTYSGSISTRFDYKNFFVEGTLYFTGGNEIYDQWPWSISNPSTSGTIALNQGTEQLFKEAWKEPGDDAFFPRFDQTNNAVSNTGETSNHWLRKGDFMRLRHLSAGYNFSEIDFIKSMGLDDLTISITGNNLFTWIRDKHLEFDPEGPEDFDQRNFKTPPIKSITFNLNLNF